MKLETATQNDLNRILEVQKKAFHGQALIYNDVSLPPLAQTIDDLRKEFKQKTIYKVELDGKIIGSIRCYITDTTLSMEKGIVDPDHQNRGIGTTVVREIEEVYAHVVKRYALFTGDKSERNLHLYKKRGYKEIRREATSRGYELISMEKSTNCVP